MATPKTQKTKKIAQDVHTRERHWKPNTELWGFTLFSFFFSLSFFW